MDIILETLQKQNDRLSNIENLLSAQKQVLTFDEVARFTGLSKSYLYKKTSTGGIPCYKPQGKCIYFDRSEIETWLLQNRKKTTDELEKEASTYVALGKKGGSR
jgi:excisionase family DNA binding protein